MSRYYNYILYNVNKPNISYNGYTIDLARRIRQHNNEIKGGARSTVINSPGWQYLAVITCPTFTKNSAMAVEWKIHYPTGSNRRPKVFNGPVGRLKSLPLIFCHEKFRHMDFNVKVCEKYYDIAKLYYNVELLEDVKNNIVIFDTFRQFDSKLIE